mmetsp:Transcript_118122/g.329350  ORF Transcript_118122/g.329350 Transcript_118122/m.329350 type:complete len:174 (+) Transcript_118122:37-558(+)
MAEEVEDIDVIVMNALVCCYDGVDMDADSKWNGCAGAYDILCCKIQCCFMPGASALKCGCIGVDVKGCDTLVNIQHRVCCCVQVMGLDACGTGSRGPTPLMLGALGLIFSFPGCRPKVSCCKRLSAILDLRPTRPISRGPNAGRDMREVELHTNQDAQDAEADAATAAAAARR